MAQYETEVIIRSLVFNVLMSGNLQEAIIRVKAYCDPDMFAAIEKEVKEAKEKMKTV